MGKNLYMKENRLMRDFGVDLLFEFYERTNESEQVIMLMQLFRSDCRSNYPLCSNENTSNTSQS